MKRAIIYCLAASSIWAASECRPCHEKQVSDYARSPMGRSIGPAAAEPASFLHQPSKTQFAVLSRNGHPYQGIGRKGLFAEYPLAYRIGSGSHATGYLVKLGQWLFQSPISHYTRPNLWDVAPGYEAMTHPDFNRRVTDECLACHSSGPREALQPISCERCHGAATLHLQKPTRANIINPARLAIEARDLVCEKCHLTGEARIPHQPADSVFVYNRPRDDLRVVSHVEQLALSACARESQGKLWCGSCHQPHGEPINVSAQCRTCHTKALSPSHAKHTECVSCHMTKRKAADGGHTAFTDHRIRRTSAAFVNSAASGLRPWRPIPNANQRERDYGLAAIQIGERDGSSDLINDGYRRLANAFPHYPRDADVLASMGMVLFLKDQTKDALTLLREAVKHRPTDAALHEKLGILHQANGDLPQARNSLEASVRLDPGRESAYFRLADCQPTTEARRQILERLLKVFPQSLIAREALRDLTRR